jgi:hypothetical protein
MSNLVMMSSIFIQQVLVENFQQVLRQQLDNGLSHLSSVNAAITGGEVT